MKKCETCKHYAIQIDNVEAGTCRFNAPVLHIVPTPQGLLKVGDWPPVNRQSFCSKHEEKIVA
jgi:hypothetical protein